MAYLVVISVLLPRITTEELNHLYDEILYRSHTEYRTWFRMTVVVYPSSSGSNSGSAVSGMGGVY